MKLVDLDTPQRPRLMLHWNVNQAASDAAESPPPSGEKVVTRVDLISGQRRPGLDHNVVARRWRPAPS